MSALEAILDIESGAISPQEALALTECTSLLELHEIAADERDGLEEDCVQAVIQWIG